MKARKNMYGANKIHNKDCILGMIELPENTIDLIVTSPPYFNAKEYSYWETYESYQEWLKEVFSGCYRVLKEGRMCCVNISVIIEARSKRSEESKRIALPYHFVNLMESIGFRFLEDIIWVKPEGSSKNRNGRFFQDRQPVQYKPNIVNEYIFVFQKPMTGCSIDKVLRGYTGEVKEISLVGDGYERTNVWYINPETKSKHPAPFPEEISNKLIEYYSYKGDIVLDCFMGSGTTGVSSKKMGRDYIGFEKETKYCEIADTRISKIKG